MIGARGLLAGAVVCALLASACGDDGDGAPGATALPERFAAGDEASFVPGACAPLVPDDRRIDCGWLVTREDHGAEVGPTVRLPVAIIRSEAPSPAPDPIVYLAGGPGDDAMATAGPLLDAGLGGPRDVIVLGQRGTGAAEPVLDCPEVEDAVRAAFAGAEAVAVEQERVVAGYRDCADRLVEEGVELDAYDTLASAADVDDLRRALGHEQVNLFGVSYGTTLALTTLREHPEGIRAVVLDSAYPTTAVNTPATIADRAGRAFATLYDACAAAPGCADAFGDLEALVARVVDRFDADPYRSTVLDPASGEEVDLVLTGGDLVLGLFDALYRTTFIPVIPATLAAIDGGDTSLLDPVAAQGLARIVSRAEGLAASVECGDRGRLRDAATDPADPAGGADAAVPEALATLVAAYDLGAVCAVWPVAPAPEPFNQPVASDTPVLALAGRFDPVTPPSFAVEATEDLTAATVIELEGMGHGVVLAHPCPAELLRTFLANPPAPLAPGCAATLAPPAWAGT